MTSQPFNAGTDDPQHRSAGRAIPILAPISPNTGGTPEILLCGMSIGKRSVQVQPQDCALCCPYHDPILQLIGGVASFDLGLSSMERFMSETSSEQSALFIRADNGELSTSKGCLCKDIPQPQRDRLTRMAIMELNQPIKDDKWGPQKVAVCWE